MVKLKDLAADRKRETEGEWNEVPELGFKDDGSSIRLLTRGLHYPPYKMDLMQTRLRLQRKYPGDQMVPPDVEDRENGRIYATHLLLGWDGIEEEYSAELALEVLRDPSQRLLRDAVVSCARIVGNARTEQKDTVAGNSVPASTGN
jgi:hypothetical protein